MYPKVKRGFDIAGALIGLLLLSPIMLSVAFLVRVTLGSPVLFRQRRPGFCERPFDCVKFRTMTNARDPQGALLPDERRETRVGRFLRKTSLDELPQLWNILTGDLSFVGPRPLLEEYIPHYTPEEHRRHLVRPGLTGWAQIHARNCLPFDQRLVMDVWYVDHMNWMLDLRILIVTAWVVLAQRGSAGDPSAERVGLHLQRSRAARSQLQREQSS